MHKQHAWLQDSGTGKNSPDSVCAGHHPGILFSVRGDERLNMLYLNYFDYFVYFDYFTFLTFVTTPDALQ